MLGKASGGRRSGFEKLETLPETGSVQQRIKDPFSVPLTDGADELEELAMVQPVGASEGPVSSEPMEVFAPALQVNMYTIRNLLDLLTTGLSTVAPEGGIYRVQKHAFGGPPGRDPGLRRLAATVMGGPVSKKRLWADSLFSQRLPVSKPIRVFPRGIDLDTIQVRAKGPEDEAEPYRYVLNGFCRMTGALGAALLLQDGSGSYGPGQVTGILRRSAGRLVFGILNSMNTKYLSMRVVLIVEGALNLLSGMEDRLVGSARNRISRLAFLPAWGNGRSAYLLLTATGGSDPWDVKAIGLKLGLVPAPGTIDP